MRHADFEIFIEEMGEATDRQVAPPDRIERYRGVLPDLLLHIWKEEGWCAYRRGLFWTVDPAGYEALAAKWIKGTPLEAIDRYHVIARTAFGELYAWGERNHQNISIGCPYNFIYALASVQRPNSHPDLSIGSFFACSQPDDYDIEDTDTDEGERLFDRALKRFGELSRTEIYGFEPALGDDGSFSLNAIKRVNLFSHLDSLRDRTGVPGVPTAIANIGKYR